MSDLLEPAASEVLVVDAAHNRRFRLVDDRDRVLPAGAVAFALESIPVAASACDSGVPYARPQRLARARADGFKLHLMPSALDEGSCLVDRIGKLHFLPSHVVEQPAAAIARPGAAELTCETIEAELSLLARYLSVPVEAERLWAQLRALKPPTIDSRVPFRALSEAQPEASAILDENTNSFVVLVGNGGIGKSFALSQRFADVKVGRYGWMPPEAPGTSKKHFLSGHGPQRSAGKG